MSDIPWRTDLFKSTLLKEVCYSPVGMYDFPRRDGELILYTLAISGFLGESPGMWLCCEQAISINNVDLIL